MRLFPQETNINFIGMRFIAFIISAVVLLGSIFYIVDKGPNFGIDFTGGTLVEVRVSEMPDIGALRNELNELELGSISLQEFGAPDDLLIRLPEQTPLAEQTEQEAQQGAISDVRAFLDAKFENVDYRRVEFVGPQVGEELKKKGFYAVLFSMIGMLAYIWFRFEWQYGVGAIIALIHDTFITVGLFSLTGMEFNLSTVAAILMIAGYSMNDTVVVFDRIRENLRKFKKMPIRELLNGSINETLSRTIMTSGTTILALVALWLFGGEVIRGFVYALIFGIGIGTFSSIFVASPVLMYLNIRHEKKNLGQNEPKNA
jgi:preprotein translocase SecF subunit